MAIDQMPLPAPHRGMPDETFSPAVDAWLGSIPRLIDQINAAVAAMNLNSTNATSATPLAIEIANKTLTVETDKSYIAGQTLKIAYTTDPTKWMLGDVISYNSATGQLVVAVQWRQGSGTFSAWSISLSAPAAVTIPAGSVTLWFQAAAPVGWTQITTHNNKSLRIVSGAGGGTGGSVAFTDAFKSQAVAGSVGATTLTTDQMPPHQHSYTDVNNAGSVSSGGSWVNSVGDVVAKWSGWTGGGSAHGHTFTGTTINLAVQYLDMILASKD